MNKLPVGKTIAFAYRFTFTELGSIIGLAWISLVGAAVLQFLPYIAGNPMAPTANPMQAGQQAIQNLGISIVVLLLYSIIYVAVTRLALGQKPGGAIAHFALGLPEFRVFGAFCLFFLLFVGLMIAAFIVGGIGVALLAGLHNEALTALAVFVLCAVVLCGAVYLAMRLGFLLIPATVVEEHISLGRGWLLTSGNFWRILGVTAGTVLPLLLIATIAVALIIGPELFHVLSTGANGDPQALSARMSEIVVRHAPVLTGLRLVLAPFQLGLSIGASAFGYRALAAPTTP